MQREMDSMYVAWGAEAAIPLGVSDLAVASDSSACINLRYDRLVRQRANNGIGDVV